MRRLLLGLVVAVATLVPNLATANDQAIARHIMSKLQLEQQRGSLKGFHIDMRVDQGTVWYEGFVTNQGQKDLILMTAQRAKHLGVVQVVDDITVRGNEMAYQATAAGQMAQQPVAANQPLAQTAYTQDYAVPPRSRTAQNNIPVAQPQVAQPQVAPPQRQPQPQPQYQGMTAAQARAQAAQAQYAQAQAAQAQYAQAQAAQAAQAQAAQAQAAQAQAAQAQAAQAQAAQAAYRGGTRQVAAQMPVTGGPMPMMQSASAPMPTSGDSAGLPGYSWPSYAAHPNYGAVTYPGQYSASAWPYIGPFYPYPQVPLGWRKVTLEWDDGWWWLDFNNR